MSESAEYKAIKDCNSSLLTCIKQSPKDISDHLEILAPDDRDYLKNDTHDAGDKARRILDAVLLQIENNPKVFDSFISALKAAGSFTKAAVQKLNGALQRRKSDQTQRMEDDGYENDSMILLQPLLRPVMTEETGSVLELPTMDDGGTTVKLLSQAESQSIDLRGQELNESPRCCNCCTRISVTFSVTLIGLIALAVYCFTPQKAFADPPPLEMATIPPRYFTTADPPKTTPSVIPAYTGKLTGTIITRGDRPKMTQLRSFKLRTGKTIDFASNIALDYRKVGQLLLEGSNDVDILEMSHHHETKDIADRILVDWLSAKGKLPVTWGTLIDVIKESGLSSLVYDIEGQLSDLHRDHDEL
ncbi:uncharacterized protein LOC135345391 [Halichondria panicea]|uniref:uncharacterized protein LOC135345391 n=1 Tax=Halichondria panicea TaxID=6063 RepID=UPI00312BB1EE